MSCPIIPFPALEQIIPEHCRPLWREYQTFCGYSAQEANTSESDIRLQHTITPELMQGIYCSKDKPAVLCLM